MLALLLVAPVFPAFATTTVTASETESSTMMMFPPSADPVVELGDRHGCVFYPDDGNVNCFAIQRQYPPYAGTTDDYLEGDAVDFRANDYTNCVLKPDGTTYCWGAYAVGDPNADLTWGDAEVDVYGKAVALEVGYGEACIITERDALVCNGIWTSGLRQPNIWNEVASGDLEFMVMGSYQVCYKLASETTTLRCQGQYVTEPVWGIEGKNGAPGVPMPAGGGHYFLCVLVQDGAIDCMNNIYHETGNSLLPPADDTIDAVDVDGKDAFTCAVGSSGVMRCYGQLNGVNNKTFELATDAVSASVGAEDVCWVTRAGDAKCWKSTPDSYDPPAEFHSFLSGDGSDVAYGPIFQSVTPVATACTQIPQVGKNDPRWGDPRPASVFADGDPNTPDAPSEIHPWPTWWNQWELLGGAKWINAWRNNLDPAQRWDKTFMTLGYSNNQDGPSFSVPTGKAPGHHYTKYERTIEGNGVFDLYSIADNCSWVYVDDVIVGFSNDSHLNKFQLSLNGTHKLTFVIYDHGGIAGGIYAMQTTSDPQSVNTDRDGDGIPNDAEEIIYGTDPDLADSDGDGFSDGEEVIAGSSPTDGSSVPGPVVSDTDGDGVLDSADNCPDVLNADQANNDGDSLGDACDPDDDNDGVNDEDDAFPFDASESADNDGDGTGDNADPDDDNDGVNDDEDAFPFDASESSDFDGDGTGDNADLDDDNDGVNDEDDAFPFDPDEWADFDKDGTGDNADPDDDNDGVMDEADSDPFNPDVDGDSILDGADYCAATNLVDNVGWGQNRWRFDITANEFVQNSAKGKSDSKGAGRGNNTKYTLASTAGCTCEQIIDKLQLGEGHKKHGCSNSAMSDWADIVAGGAGKGMTDAFASDMSELPTEVTLEGNYPNPFNPQTTIRFGLPEASEVSLVVYDAMGREVQVLVRGTLSAGTHSASFDASSLPSGAYIYRLVTPGQQFSKVMMLLK